MPKGMRAYGFCRVAERGKVVVFKRRRKMEAFSFVKRFFCNVPVHIVIVIALEDAGLKKYGQSFRHRTQLLERSVVQTPQRYKR